MPYESTRDVAGMTSAERVFEVGEFDERQRARATRSRDEARGHGPRSAGSNRAAPDHSSTSGMRALSRARGSDGTMGDSSQLEKPNTSACVERPPVSSLLSTWDDDVP